MPVIFMAGSPLQSVGNTYNALYADQERQKQEEEDKRRFNLEHARRVENDLYARESDQRDFDRGVYESDRGFSAGQEAQAYAREIGEERYADTQERQDRAFDLQVQREERYMQQGRPAGSRRPSKMDGRSILNGLHRLRRLDPEAARDLEGKIQRRTGKLGIQPGDLEEDDLLRLDAYSDVWNAVDTANRKVATTINTEASEQITSIAAQAMEGVKLPQTQKNISERVSEALETYSSNVLDPRAAATGAKNLESMVERIIDEEQRRERYFFEAESMLAADDLAADPVEAAQLKNTILTSEGDPTKPWLDFRALVVPTEGSQRSLGMREAAAAAGREMSGMASRDGAIAAAMGQSDPTRQVTDVVIKHFPRWLNAQEGMTVEQFNKMPREEQDEQIEKYKAERSSRMTARDIRIMKEALNDPTVPGYKREEYREKLIEAGEIDR